MIIILDDIDQLQHCISTIHLLLLLIKYIDKVWYLLKNDENKQATSAHGNTYSLLLPLLRLICCE